MTEKELNEYSIFALREVARRVGVSSPTSKKKDQLIKEILEINSGERKPQTEKNKQGRPPKNFGYSFIDVLQPENSVLNTVQGPRIIFNQEIEPFEYNECRTAWGYVETVNANTSFLWVKNDLEFNCYLIPYNFVNEYKLKYGDMLNVELGSGEERMLVKEILSINAFPIKKYVAKRADYDKIAHITPKRNVGFENAEFLNLGIKFGESVYLYGDNNNNNSYAVLSLLNACSVKRKLYLNLSIAEKNKNLLSSAINTELFVASVMEGAGKAKKLISIAVERAKRLLENGEDVVLVVDDVLSCWAIDEPEHMFIKKLMTATKEAGKKGSITLLAVMNNDSELKIFEKLADKRLKISENSISII